MTSIIPNELFAVIFRVQIGGKLDGGRVDHLSVYAVGQSIQKAV